MDATSPSAITPGSSTSLAVERTRLAHERTLLAWVRTATSLISFGFTIYKFVQYLEQRNPEYAAGHIFTAREFAIIMIGTGIVALIIATVQHRRDVVRMRVQFPEVQHSLATVLAVLLSILGTIALVTVFLRQ
ncbi:MAG TPA: DUF202 domain-containing protein [Pyrinomonadaceae bacterium]|nr:DUF202 domain-containing protein [Pyrinomonadaceae bacterium]